MNKKLLVSLLLLVFCAPIAHADFMSGYQKAKSKVVSTTQKVENKTTSALNKIDSTINAATSTATETENAVKAQKQYLKQQKTELKNQKNATINSYKSAINKKKAEIAAIKKSTTLTDAQKEAKTKIINAQIEALQKKRSNAEAAYNKKIDALKI